MRADVRTGAVVNAPPTRLDLTNDATTALPFDGLLTADGRYVFGLVGEATARRVVRHDLTTGALVTFPAPASGWAAANGVGSVSDAGTVVTSWWIDAGLETHLMQLDVATSSWVELRAPQATLPATAASVSGDGLVTVFDQPADDGSSHPWIRRADGTLERLGADCGGSSCNVEDISRDGRFVLLDMGWPNLGLAVHDRAAATTQRLPLRSFYRYGHYGSISDDGRRVATGVVSVVTFPDGSSLAVDQPAVHDLTTGTTTMLMPTQDWASALRIPTILLSGDGRRVAFTTNGATDPYDLAPLLPPTGLQLVVAALAPPT